VSNLNNAHQKILNVADVALIATDDRGVILDVSAPACEMFGYTRPEMLGMSVHQLLPPPIRAAHAQHLAKFVAGSEKFRRMRERGDITGCRRDGTLFTLEASIAKISNGTSWLLVVTLQDATKRKRSEEELTWLVTHDALTGLENRTLIRERLNTALDRSRRHDGNVALLLIDLDNFKAVNDSYGHEAGDELLKAISARLMEQVRRGDSVARLAGDEFVVLCDRVEQLSEAAILAERINDVLRRPIRLSTEQIAVVTASIGIATGHGNVHNVDDLLRNAETAMYAVKSRGRDGWQFFNDSIEAEARQRVMIIHGLRLALERQEFTVLYQPIVAVEGRRVIGAEALLRWHPPSGEISPVVFIPIAEDNGAIVPIGAWVFRQACQTAAAWRARFGDDTPYVAVNVSTRQLDAPHLIEDFTKIIRDTGVYPADILIEITETALMSNIEASISTLHQLAKLGLRVAVDDFGTGYSSLAQLLRLPVSIVKIDRAFINGIDIKTELRVVTAAIIRMAHTLGHRLVAEGVETESQLAELRMLGCDYAQGYLFHRPLNSSAILEIIDCRQQVVIHGQLEVFYVVYVSEATASFTPDQLENLIDHSRKANYLVGITGCLIYQDQTFMQMIEGSRSQVEILIARIALDPRHRKVTIVLQGTAQRRVFPDWSMGLRDMSRLSDQPDIKNWRRRKISLLELAEDAMTCYAYITAFARPY